MSIVEPQKADSGDTGPVKSVPSDPPDERSVADGPIDGLESASTEELNGTRSKTVRGTTWTVLGFGANQGLRLVGNLFLARLLFPEAFGLMALVNTFLQGLQMLSDVGIGPVIIQNKRGEDDAFLGTAWTIQVARGALLWILSLILAWPMARLYDEPQLMTMIAVASFSTMIAGLNSTALYTANRKLHVGKLTLIEMASQLGSLVVMIAFAAIYRSVWALVAGTLIAATVRLVLSHRVLSTRRDRLRWHKPYGIEIFHFAKWIFISSGVTFFALQIDRLLLGKFVAMSTLGVYSMAMSIATLPTMLMTQIGRIVLYPVLSEQARENPEGFGARLHGIRGPLLAVGSVLVLGVVLGSPVFFGYFYDERYQDAIWMSQLISVWVWISVLEASTGFALWALGNTRAPTLAFAIRLVFTTIGCVVGHQFFGLEGFILGIAVGVLSCYLTVGIALARHKAWIFTQDAKYTSAVLSILGAAFGLQYLLSSLLGVLTEIQAYLAATIAVLVPIAVVVARRFKREVLS